MRVSAPKGGGHSPALGRSPPLWEVALGHFLIVSLAEGQGYEGFGAQGRRPQPQTVDRGPWTVDRGPWTVDCGVQLFELN